jgi:hypothetical protein
VVDHLESRTVAVWRDLNVVERCSVEDEISLEPAISGFLGPAAAFVPE